MFEPILKRYRVFCPRCGDSRKIDTRPKDIQSVIDKACERCKLVGLDAVEVTT